MAKTKTNNGGPAFPVPMVSDGNVVGDVNFHGMTLRDYLAAKALPGVLQLRAALALRGEGEDVLSDNQEDIADECWQLADALIAKRDVDQDEEE